MSLDNNNEPGNIQDQVKNVLSGIGGEAGDFLSEPAPTGEAVNLGYLFRLILVARCGENHIHQEAFLPEQFLEFFAGKHARNYFENFSAIGMFQTGKLPIDQSDIDRLLQKAEELEKANEGLKKHFDYVQTLADELSIKNSHLKVENDVLRQELDRLRPDREKPGETALDYRPSKRQWKFAAVIKTIRTIGEGR